MKPPGVRYWILVHCVLQLLQVLRSRTQGALNSLTRPGTGAASLLPPPLPHPAPQWQHPGSEREQWEPSRRFESLPGQECVRHLTHSAAWRTSKAQSQQRASQSPSQRLRPAGRVNSHLWLVHPWRGEGLGHYLNLFRVDGQHCTEGVAPEFHVLQALPRALSARALLPAELAVRVSVASLQAFASCDFCSRRQARSSA